MTVKPCKNFCINVMRGCLARVQNLDLHWNEFVDSMKGLTKHMEGETSLDVAMGNVHQQITNAIMHATQNTHRFYDKVIDHCGNPQTSKKRTTQTETKHTPLTSLQVPTENKPSLSDRITHFLKSLASSKNFYRNFPDTLCNNTKFVVKGDEGCWNGEAQAEYTKPVSGLTYQSQVKHNPEMHVSNKKDTAIMTLQGKLASLTKQLRNKKLDSVQHDTWYYNPSSGYGDDEDFEVSGSGGYPSSGHQPYNKVTNPSRRRPPNYNKDITFVDDNGHYPYQTVSPPVAQDNKGRAHALAYCGLTLFVTAILSISLRLNG